MTNGEKYSDELAEVIMGGNFCENFLTPYILFPAGLSCCDRSCYRCLDLLKNFLKSEYVEPAIDWSKILVDTPILVSDTENDGWIKRHFAKIENGVVYAWNEGKTSFTAKAHECTGWYHAKLAEDE